MGDGRVAAVNDLQDERRQAVAVEGVLEGHHFVKQAAQRPDVALLVVRLVFAQLGRHVVRRANHGLGKVALGGEHLGNAKVAQLGQALRRQKHVLGLDVAVQDVAVMNVL